MIKLIVAILLLPAIVHAGPSIAFTAGKWETTFNYAACMQRGGLGGTEAADCAVVQTDGLYWSWGAGQIFCDANGQNCCGDSVVGCTGVKAYTTEVTAASNYTGGAGGNGFRQWIASTGIDNTNTAPVRINFPTPQKEFWIRFYHRYESGFAWLRDGAAGKEPYFWAVGSDGNRQWSGSTYMGDAYANSLSMYNQGGGGGPPYPYSTTGGFVTKYPTGTSDGSWHCTEVYLKMDTGIANGVGRIWVDGVLHAEATNVNWSTAASRPEQTAYALAGWSFIEILSNKKDPKLTRIYYEDLDDIAIYNSTPPGRDMAGNPWIGPISQPAAPRGLAVTGTTP